MPEQISPLRQRMIDDMSLRNVAALTQAAYIRAVKNFSKHFGKSPDKLTFEDVRQYQLSLVGRGLGPQAINQIMCALRTLLHDHWPLLCSAANSAAKRGNRSNRHEDHWLSKDVLHCRFGSVIERCRPTSVLWSNYRAVDVDRRVEILAY